MSLAAARAGTLWHPYTQHALADPAVFIERAKGGWLHAQDGRRIFDAISSWWVNLHGHAHPHIAAAVARQARTLEQVIFAGFTHAPAEELAKALIELTPAGLKHVFLSDNGSTAVEVALKMAVGCWRARGEKRTRFAALEHAYHGDTFGAMSVTARGPFAAGLEELLFPVTRLPFPEPGAEERTLKAFAELLTRGEGELAGLIVEPLVLGAGGMRMYPAHVLAALARECSRRGVPLIADEVMTGFGRAGKMFACELADVSPDILCLSKGITGGFLALGATLATEEIYRAFYSTDRGKALFHGHSYSGNPLACAAAVANLEIFDSEPVLHRIAEIGEVHRRELPRFYGRPEVASARHLGTIAAVELSVPEAGYLSEIGPKLGKFYLSKNVLLRPLGNVVYILPPYCSRETELRRVYDVIEESLSLIDAR